MVVRRRRGEWPVIILCHGELVRGCTRDPLKEFSPGSAKLEGLGNDVGRRSMGDVL